MNVFFLSDMKSDTRKRLQRTLEYMLPRKNIKYLRSVQDLEAQLRKSSTKTPLTVILYVSRPKLSHLSSIKDLLEDARLILILQNKNAETIALGHALRPRFVTFDDGDFLDIASVLMKMKDQMAAKEVSP
ncbi:MAG TPA: hypothetical protein PKN70_06725 [Smithellaceae bacterium]|jgi:hypothetical protein|nr:hypothetical protein [Smithellaceae bacterium]HQM45699.1 hypothetical protein [Smithellaceae bacterium]